MDGNKLNKPPEGEIWQSHAIIIRCSGDTYDRIISWVNLLPDCYLVFSKTSNLKLRVREEGW